MVAVEMLARATGLIKPRGAASKMLPHKAVGKGPRFPIMWPIPGGCLHILIGQLAYPRAIIKKGKVGAPGQLSLLREQPLISAQVLITGF